ncbi:MAG: hypothetical protein ACLUOI_14930 [Eisenbergiella sp.]
MAHGPCKGRPLENGADPDVLDSIHMPIGLPIGAETPRRSYPSWPRSFRKEPLLQTGRLYQRNPERHSE